MKSLKLTQERLIKEETFIKAIRHSAHVLVVFWDVYPLPSTPTKNAWLFFGKCFCLPSLIIWCGRDRLHLCFKGKSWLVQSKEYILSPCPQWLVQSWASSLVWMNESESQDFCKTNWKGVSLFLWIMWVIVWGLELVQPFC